MKNPLIAIGLFLAGLVLSFLQGFLIATIGDWYHLFTISPIQAIGVGQLVFIFTYAYARNPKFGAPADRSGDAGWWEEQLWFLVYHSVILVIAFLLALLWTQFI